MENHNNPRCDYELDRASVEAIFHPDGAAASPPAHVGSSPSRAPFPPFSPETPKLESALRTRPASFTPRNSNRLSLNLPVAPALGVSESARPTPTSASLVPSPSTPADFPLSPDDPTAFLTALAGQERRVLELKDELDKAEADLEFLKKKWAYHERSKKRAEARNMQQLQTVAPDGTEEDVAAKRQSEELDRRKALLLNTPRLPKGSRRIIRGGHTRTLSLLSPDRSTYNKTFAAFPNTSSETSSSRTTAMPDTSQGISRINTNRARHSYQSGVTLGAKQIAEDVKAGLWTFLEDLRQATVGEEATSPTSDISTLGLRKAGSRGSLRARRVNSPRIQTRSWDSLTGSPQALMDAANLSRSHSKSPAATVKRKPSKPMSLSATAVMDDDDGWAAWDSPIPKSPLRWSGSSAGTVASGPETPSAPGRHDDDLVRIAHQADEPAPRCQDIQWPALDSLALDNFSPGNLKRTVSTLMKEWEKSITPPPVGESKDLLTGSPLSSRSTAAELQAARSAAMDHWH